MKDQSRHHACPNGKRCAIAWVRPSPAGNYYQPSPCDQFESVGDHALNMYPESPLRQPSRSPQSN
jgi:hypothetical protein